MNARGLELRGVSKSYRNGTTQRVVLDDVDLSVDPGEVVVLFGRSGSGKTTLLTVASGFAVPDAGDVLIAGEAVFADARWRRVALLPQSLGLLDELTVAENVAIPARLDSSTSAVDVEEVLGSLSLDHLADRLPSELSLGEQQRTALARATSVAPAVLVADEPVSHQNAALAGSMIDRISSLAARGTACLLATHDESVVRIAHRVVELREGRLSSR